MAVAAYSACLLELARIIELEIDTDDQQDPSCKHMPDYVQSSDRRPINDIALDGVVVFLILSVAEEVCAIICATLPVVAPQLLREYKNKRSSHKTDNSYSSRLGTASQPRSMIKGFQKLGEGSGSQMYEGPTLTGDEDGASGSIPLNTVVAEHPPQTEDPGEAQIVVKREYEVTVGGSRAHPA